MWGIQLNEDGFSVVSLDCRPSVKAEITINKWILDYKKYYKPGHFALIAAGVPCTEYSVAKTTKPRDLEAADLLVAKTLEIIAFFSAKKMVGREPKVGLAQKQKIMENIPFWM